MTEQEFAAHEARLRQAWAVRAELDACLAEIRALQMRRCRLEAQVRQMHREARERQEEAHAA